MVYSVAIIRTSAKSDPDVQTAAANEPADTAPRRVGAGDIRSTRGACNGDEDRTISLKEGDDDFEITLTQYKPIDAWRS